MHAWLALLVLLAGCMNHTYWGRPWATPDQFATAVLVCEREVTGDYSWCVGMGCVSQDMAMRKRRETCLRARGWQEYPGRLPDGSPPPR